ncbi:hypothetical protein J6590_023043 [Homalodisca vitripennis]|nr:hypothetical protein J6590_023043 [Homalodisca vitripennis]
MARFGFMGGVCLLQCIVLNIDAAQRGGVVWFHGWCLPVTMYPWWRGLISRVVFACNNVSFSILMLHNGGEVVWPRWRGLVSRVVFAYNNVSFSILMLHSAVARFGFMGGVCLLQCIVLNIDAAQRGGEVVFAYNNVSFSILMLHSAVARFGFMGGVCLLQCIVLNIDAAQRVGVVWIHGFSETPEQFNINIDATQRGGVTQRCGFTGGDAAIVLFSLALSQLNTRDVQFGITVHFANVTQTTLKYGRQITPTQEDTPQNMVWHRSQLISRARGGELRRHARSSHCPGEERAANCYRLVCTITARPGVSMAGRTWTAAATSIRGGYCARPAARPAYSTAS